MPGAADEEGGDDDGCKELGAGDFVVVLLEPIDGSGCEDDEVAYPPVNEETGDEAGGEDEPRSWRFQRLLGRSDVLCDLDRSVVDEGDHCGRGEAHDVEGKARRNGHAHVIEEGRADVEEVRTAC